MVTILTCSSIFLPKEIIFEMLSYLPVKSLLRFKCVSKHWNATTLDFQFICLHFKRSPVLINKKPLEMSYAAGKEEFIVLSSNGLILEYLICWVPSSPNFIYRIRNPEMHQILEIPDSQNNILEMRMVVDTDNQLLKLLSVIHVVGLALKVPLGYEVLDLRNEEGTYSWQTLDLPKDSRGETTILQNRICRHSTLFKIEGAMGTDYIMWDTANSHIGIDIVDMVNDNYIGHTTFPIGFYSKNDCIIWKRKLSFAKVVKDEVHVMVLEDYNKQQIKWAEAKLIIKLPFLKEVVQERVKVLACRRSELCFSRWNWDKKSICIYDFKTGKVTTIVSSCNTYDLFEFIRPCLFACRGMHADREENLRQSCCANLWQSTTKTKFEEGVADAETPEPMDIMTALQLVLRKSGAHGGLARGLHEGAKVIEKHVVQLCVLAEDCDQPDYDKLVKALCADHNVSLIIVPSAKILDEWAGRGCCCCCCCRDSCPSTCRAQAYHDCFTVGAQEV